MLDPLFLVCVMLFVAVASLIYSLRCECRDWRKVIKTQAWRVTVLHRALTHNGGRNA
jgi:hypothetical protein